MTGRLRLCGVRNHIHGLSPFPGAITGFQAGGTVERLKVLRAELAELGGQPGEILDDRMTIACGAASIRALQVQRPGRNVISGAEFMRSGAAQTGAIIDRAALGFRRERAVADVLAKEAAVPLHGVNGGVSAFARAGEV